MKECTMGIFQDKYKHLQVDIFTKENKRATSITSNWDEVNTIALRKAKIVYNIGLSECKMFKRILISTYSSEKRVTDEYKLDTSSEDAFLKSYKEL